MNKTHDIFDAAKRNNASGISDWFFYQVVRISKSLFVDVKPRLKVPKRETVWMRSQKSCAKTNSRS